MLIGAEQIRNIEIKCNNFYNFALQNLIRNVCHLLLSEKIGHQQRNELMVKAFSLSYYEESARENSYFGGRIIVGEQGGSTGQKAMFKEPTVSK